MSQQQQQFVNKRKPNALSEYKLRLTGKPVQDGGRAPTLSVAIVKNQPHITVRTNVENDKNYGKIEAKIDTPTLFALITQIDKIADGENGVRFSIQNMGHPFTNGQRSKDPKLDTKITVGKTAEGVVWIAVTSWEQARPIIQFSFAPSQYHNWVKSDGSAFSEAEISQIYAKSWTKQLAELVPFILHTEYVEPEQRNFGGQGGGGGGNWNNNNRGGGGGQQQGGGQRSGGNDFGGGDGGGFDDGLPL